MRHSISFVSEERHPLSKGTVPQTDPNRGLSGVQCAPLTRPARSRTCRCPAALLAGCRVSVQRPSEGTCLPGSGGSFAQAVFVSPGVCPAALWGLGAPPRPDTKCWRPPPWDL